MLDKFRVFLERNVPVLRALRAWTLRIVVPPLLGAESRSGRNGVLVDHATETIPTPNANSLGR